MATREDFFSVLKPKTKPVQIEGLPDTLNPVHIRYMSGQDAARWFNDAAAMIDQKTGEIREPEIYRACLVQLGTCKDESGTPLFAESDLRRIAQELPHGVIEELFVAIVRLNKLSRNEVKAAGASFFATPTSSTSTASPGSSVAA